MNVKELAATITRAADGYAASCEVLSVSRFGADGSAVRLTVDAGYDGETHEQVLHLKRKDREEEGIPCQNGTD